VPSRIAATEIRSVGTHQLFEPTTLLSEPGILRLHAAKSIDKEQRCHPGADRAGDNTEFCLAADRLASPGFVNGRCDQTSISTAHCASQHNRWLATLNVGGYYSARTRAKECSNQDEMSKNPRLAIARL
jgi:hypothetical protein